MPDTKKPTSSPAVPENPTLPDEVNRFTKTLLPVASITFTVDEWMSGLRSTEIRDKAQQIRLRPWFAFGVFVLLTAQNVGIWLLVVWALEAGQLKDLQLIFTSLVGGSLTQSYFILRLITKKVFDDIDYHNKLSDS